MSYFTYPTVFKWFKVSVLQKHRISEIHFRQKGKITVPLKITKDPAENTVNLLLEGTIKCNELKIYKCNGPKTVEFQEIYLEYHSGPAVEIIIK